MGNFRPIDPAMGVAQGSFHPALEYERIRSTIRNYLFDTNGDVRTHSDPQIPELYAKLDALQLTAKTASGLLLHPVGVFINDFKEELNEQQVELFGLPSMELDLLSSEV